MADPSREHLELLLANARPFGDRVALGARRDRDQAVRPVGVQAVSHRDAAQSSLGHGVVRDHAEELLERTAAGLHGAGENLALGGPVAVGDGERGELVPEEEEATERREEARVQLARLHRGDAVLPDQAPRDRVAVQEDDHRAVGPRRDRSRSALDRHDRLEVKRALDLASPGLGQKAVERVGGNGTTWRPRAFPALEPAQLRLDRCDRRGLRSQLPLERDRADEDAQTDIIERLAELGRHGRCQLLGVRQRAADRRPEVVGPVHGILGDALPHCGGVARFLQRMAPASPDCVRCQSCCAVPAIAIPPFCSVEVMTRRAPSPTIVGAHHAPHQGPMSRRIGSWRTHLRPRGLTREKDHYTNDSSSPSAGWPAWLRHPPWSPRWPWQPRPPRPWRRPAPDRVLPRRHQPHRRPDRRARHRRRSTRPAATSVSTSPDQRQQRRHLRRGLLRRRRQRRRTST